MYELSIDVGGTTSKCAIFKEGKIFKKFIIKTKTDNVFQNIFNGLMIELNNINILYSDIKWISFSIAGAINMNTNILEWSGNLKLYNYDLNAAIKTIFDKPFYVINDAKAAAFGEWVLGQNKKPKSIAVITIGTGIGTALILDSKIWFGTNLYIGSEGGHGANMSNKECTCGISGCVESESSATGIEKSLNSEKNKEYIESILKIKKEHYTIKDVANLIKNGDKIITNSISNSLVPLSNSIAFLMYWLDLNKIIIGGGVSELGDSLIDIIKLNVKKSMSKFMYLNTTIETAILKNDAGIWGAFFWGIEHNKK